MISQNKIKQIQSLKTKKGRTKEGLFLVEGVRCISSYLEHSDDLKELFGQKKIKDELFKSHFQSLIEAKLLNPNKVQSWVNPF